ncbi:MAG: hypothetical protein WA628_01660 [Terriglobales bacterium]
MRTPLTAMIDHLSRNDIEKVRLSVQSFGFGLLSSSIVPSVLTGLQEEAGERKGVASLAEQSEDLKYRANIVPLGPKARDFLCSRQLTELLSAVFGGSFVLTEHRSCLTFYEEGDHLGPHLDKPAEECVVTIIVCVAALGPDWRSPQSGLELRVYGQELAGDRKTLLTIPTHTGDIVIGHGSKFWHERPTLQKDEQVAALTGCYSFAKCLNDTAVDRMHSSELPDDPSTSSTETVG